MDDHYGAFDAALSEIEGLRKLVSLLKVKQVRSSEHRDILKATALTWFRVRRPAIASSASKDILESVDLPFRIILDACERDSAKTTYSKAIVEAKKALIAARGVALTSQPASTSTDASPVFTALASDKLMQSILERRWQECIRCLAANAPLAGAVMMGGLLEALFVARANMLADKGRLFTCKATPIDGKTKKPLELRHWTLAPYIDVGRELDWISRSAKDVAAILRDYRNYIHPEKERSHGINLSQDDATMLWEVTKSLCRELLAMKGFA